MNWCETARADVPVWNSNNATSLHLESVASSTDSLCGPAQAKCVKYARILNGQNCISYNRQGDSQMDCNQRMRVYKTVMNVQKHHECQNQGRNSEQIEKSNNQRTSRHHTYYQNKLDREAKTTDNVKKVKYAGKPCSYERPKSLSPSRSNPSKKPSDREDNKTDEEQHSPCDQSSRINFSNVKAKVNTFLGKKPQKDMKTRFALDEKNNSRKSVRTTHDIKKAINDALSEFTKSKDQEFDECTPSVCQRKFKQQSPLSVKIVEEMSHRVNASLLSDNSACLNDAESPSTVNGKVSFPGLTVPNIKLIRRNAGSNKARTSSNADNKSVYIRQVISYTSSQKVNLEYDQASQDLQKNEVCNLDCISGVSNIIKDSQNNYDDISTKALDDLMKEEWSMPASYSELFQPSKLFRELSNKKILESTLFSDQFQKELKFIVAFLESLHYLENNKISKYLEFSKNEAQKEFNNNLQSKNSNYSNHCHLMDSLSGEESFMSSIKCLHLLNLLLKDEQRRTRNLMHVFKKRESALFDHTKSQIIDYESRKKSTDTNLSTLKKKIRGALVKLQQECGEMERMKKALLSISERRRTALLQTKKTIEMKLKQSALNADKPLKRVTSNSVPKKSSPMKCFDLSNTSSYENEGPTFKPCKVLINKGQEMSKTNILVKDSGNFTPHTSLNSEAAQTSLFLTDNASQMSCKRGDTQVVNVDGEYMNIIFRSIGLPSVFCGGKDYEINEAALKNLIDTTENAKNGLRNGVNLENSVKNLMDSVNSVQSSPSTARSLVDELEEYFMNFADEPENDEVKNQTERDFEKLVVCADKSLTQTNIDNEAKPECVESFEDVKYLEKIKSCDDKVPSIVDAVLKEKKNLDPKSDGSLDTKESMKSCLDEYDFNFEYEESYVDVSNSKEVITNVHEPDKTDEVLEKNDSDMSGCDGPSLQVEHSDEWLTVTLHGGDANDEGRFDRENDVDTANYKPLESVETITGDSENFYKADECADFVVSQSFDTGPSDDAASAISEAEELRKKQLALEMEIKALEQQSQMYQIRPIPDKPPPPYTWPERNGAASNTDFPYNIERVLDYARLYTDMICKGTSTRQEVIEKAKCLNLFTTESFDDFLFDFIYEANEKYRVKHAKEPWDPINVIPGKQDREPIEVKIENAIKEVLGDTPKDDDTIHIDTTKRIDDIDDILFKEWKEYESMWCSLERDEIEVKNQLRNSIMYNLVDETINEYLNFCHM